MGLLDQVIGSVLNSRTGGQAGGIGGGPGGMGGAFGGGSSPLVMALMALLGSGALGGGGGGGGLGGLLGGLAGGGTGGGLGGLLERFQRNGHGDAFQSWVGPGENRPVAPHELNEALGQDTVDQLSRQTGMPEGDLLRELSRVLPQVVNGLTPQGRMPAGNETAGW